MSLDFDLEMNLDTGDTEPFRVELFSGNLTHNVTPMWQLAGCYEALYESHGKLAQDVLPCLTLALSHMRNSAHLSAYEALNPKNGWGSVRTAVEFLSEVTGACRRHPKATISISR